MAIELERGVRDQAIRSIERYFEQELDHKIGNIGAGALLGYFLEELAPLVYNQAVAEVQERLGQRVAEIDLEVHEDAFQYWRRREAKARR